jgi:hypothetical protein
MLISGQPVPYLNFQMIPAGLGVDFPNALHSSYDATGLAPTRKLEAFQLIGFHASALESAVIEEVANEESISTMRGLVRAFDDKRGKMAGAGGTVDREAVQVFESLVPTGQTTRVIYFRGEIGANVATPYNPSSTATRTRAQLLNTTTGELRNHVRPGVAIDDSEADRIVDLLENSSQQAIGTIRVLVPRSRSELGNLIGSVFVAEYATEEQLIGSYIITPDVGPSANGAYGVGTIAPENLLRPKGARPYATYAGDPVDVANGNVFREETDIIVPNLGVPLTFSRHYDSQAKDDLGLGVGWTYSFGDLLIKQSATSDDLLWLASDGIRHVFKKNASNGYDAPASLQGEV